jgi:hypothetical protein
MIIDSPWDNLDLIICELSTEGQKKIFLGKDLGATSGQNDDNLLVLLGRSDDDNRGGYKQ